jgi:hypothetical protein
MVETGITKNEIISQLARSPHGKLEEYVPVGQRAAKEEAEFLAHLIAWNHIKGQIRDSKIALPVVSLSVPQYPDELVVNSLAHIVSLDPRNVVRAFRYAKYLKVTGHMVALKIALSAYLRKLESNNKRFDRVAMQHRASVKELYALLHLKPDKRAADILFNGIYPKGSVFEVIRNLKDMSPQEAAGAILNYRIPFLVVTSLGEKAKSPDFVLAMIERMSPTELVTHQPMLERLGVKTVPALRAAFEQALDRAAKGKTNVLKAAKAAEAIEDPALKSKMQVVAEKRIDSSSVQGDWLVLVDKSGSMHQSIEAGRHIAATLARYVKGKVQMVFFDTAHRAYDATGKTFQQIQGETRLVQAAGGTSIGVGLSWALAAKIEVDGIAIVSDGGENNSPQFVDVYRKYEKAFDKSPTVYFYHVDGDGDCLTDSLNQAGIEFTKFEVGSRMAVDFYSLPNLCATMRTNRFSLVDEIMATPLKTLAEVLGGHEQSQEV